MLERRIVIKLTGSLFTKNSSYLLKNYVELFDYLIRRNYRFVIVTGGGQIAREYIALGRKFSLDEAFLDELGIAITRVNAKLLVGLMLKKGLPVYPSVPESLESLRAAFYGNRNCKAFVLGGLQPGHSTDAVAALAAETIGARLLIVGTKVDGVYLANGKLASELTIDELEKVISSLKSKAGTYELFDKTALEIVKRSKIKLWFVNAYKPAQLLGVLRGEDVGTLVKL